MIAYAREILDTSPAHQYNTMLLQVMTNARYIGGHFYPMSQADTGHFTQGRVRLLWRQSSNHCADASFLRAAIKSR